MKRVFSIDPGLNWAMAWRGGNWIQHEAWKAKDIEDVFLTLDANIISAGSVVAIEETWQPINKTSPKTVALLNQIIGVCKTWAWSNGSSVVDVPVYPSGRGWKASYKLVGATDRQIKQAARVYGKLAEEPKTVHEACAVLMLLWAERRLTA